MRRALLLSTLLIGFSAGVAAQSSHLDFKAQAKKPALAGSASPAALQAARVSFAKLPLSFEENRGQTDARVKFLSRAANYNLFLTADEAVLTLRGGSADLGCAKMATRKDTGCATGGTPGAAKNAAESSVLWLKMLGTNPSAQIGGTDVLPGKINYYVGKDPNNWHTGVRQFGRVGYRNIYPGVDLTFYGNQGQLESDYLVAPGANPHAIEFEIRGARESRLDPQGNLVVVTGVGNVRLLRPGVYQMVKGVRHDVSGRYVLRGKNRVGFEIAKYDVRNALIIDPVLVYSTFLGGSTLYTADTGNAIAIDSTGAAYVTGAGASSDFPGAALNGPVAQATPFVFVTKFDPTGNTLVYSTLLRGTTGYTNSGNGIGVDSSGNAYVAGITNDSDFPLVNPFQATAGNGVASDQTTGFVAGLATDGTLLYSTYLGGRNEQDTTTIQGLYADAAGNAYVVGSTTSQNFPTVNPYQATLNTSSDESNAIVAKFNPQGQPIYSTYLGGNSYDVGNAIVADASGNAYVTGETSSSNFPVKATPAPFQATFNGGYDVFITKLSFDTVHSTLSLAASTFLGGSGTDEGYGIAIDSASPPNVYITGTTNSSGAGASGFPTKNPISGTYAGVPYSGATNAGGSDDAFVTKLQGDFTALIYSSYLGGTGADIGYGIALDGASPPNAYLTGSTTSANFPLASPLQLGAYTGTHAFVTEVSGTGSVLNYSTYLEGLGSDQGRGIAADSTGNAYTTGGTSSPNFPVLSSVSPTTPPFQGQLGSSTGNAYVAKISPAVAPSALTFVPPAYNFHNVGVGPATNGTGGFGTEAVTLTNNTASSVTINSFVFTGTNSGDFTLQSASAPCSISAAFALPAGASCSLLIRFTPADQDQRTAQLTINSTPASSTVLNLSGFGAVPEISLSTNSMNFGTNVPLNTGTLNIVEVTNTGGATLNVGSAQITGTNASAFTLTENSCASVAPNSSCFIEVTFTPTAAQAYSANLLINDNVAGSPQTVTLSGTGVAQVIVTPLSHEYAGWIIGTTSTDQDFFLNNGSGGSVTLTSITPGGGGTQGDFPNDTNSSTCKNGLVLPAGAGCNLEVYFKPGVSGPTNTVDGRTGTFTFNWTGTLAGSQQVTVMGAAETGVSLYVNSIPAPSEYVGVTESESGADIIYNGTVNPVTVTSIVVSGTNPQDWTAALGSSPTGNDCSADGIVPANSYCYIAGSFTPSAVGVRTATATINYTGAPPNTPLVLTLSGTGLPGPVSFPGGLALGSQIVSLTSPTHRVLLQNTQKTPLAISLISAPSGTNAGDFAILSSSTCVSSITVRGGGNCYLDLTFTPGATGSRTATITVTDNGPGSPRNLVLTGTGVTGSDQISVNPTVVDFGNVPLVIPSASQTTLTGAFFLTNGGNSPTTITTSTASPNPALTSTPSPFALVTGIGSSCAPTPTATPIVTTVLPQGGTCSVEVTFKPTAAGEVSNTVTLTDSLGGLHTVTIQGNGVTQGAIAVSSLTITQLPGTTSSPQAVTVTNSGSGPFTITSLSLSEGLASNFAIVPAGTTCTLGAAIPAAPGPGNTCVVMVTFTAPSATGSTGARLTVNANLGNGVNGSGSTTITGTVVTGGFTVSPAAPLNFGTVAIGTTVDFLQLSNNYITITNNNPGSVTITSVAPQTGTDFAVTNNSCTGVIAANNSCTLDVTFTPSVNAAETNNIQISYTGANSASSPFSIAVKGTGSNAVVASPNPLNVTTTIGGGSGPTVTIGNGSASTVTITGTTAVTPSGSPFSVSFNTCATLTAAGTGGNTCQIYLNFSPTTPGTFPAQFSVTYTVGSNPTVQSLVVNLSGVATAPQETISPNPVTFPSQNVNTQSQIMNVVVTNTGNSQLYFSVLPTITGPNANDFALAPLNYNNSCFGLYTVQPGQSCTIAVNFTPSQLTAGTSRTATLTFGDNAYPSGTHMVSLAGTAGGGSVFTETTNLSFPQTNVGSTATQGVLFSNTTSAAVVFNGVTYSTAAPPSGPYSTVSGTNSCVTGKALSAFTGTCVIYIQFSPTGVTNNSTATVHYGASGTIGISLSGTGSNPAVTASPNPLTFTSTRINTTSGQGSVTLTNATATAVSVTTTVTTAASISGTNSSDFQVVASGTTCTSGFSLAAINGTCNAVVTFSPTPGALGARTATLTILASDANSPHIVTLNGIAIGPNAQVPTSLAFGSQATGQTSTMSLTVSNNGTDTLNLAASGAFAIASGGDSSFFGIGTSAQGTTCSNGLAIGANSSCVIIVTFSPTTVRSYGPVTLTVTDDSGAVVGSTQQVSITGAGVAAQVGLNPSPVTFTTGQDVGTTSSNLTLTLTNSGGLALHLAASNAVSIGAPGNAASDFAVVSTGTTCVNGFTVPALGGTCNIVLAFTPGATGARSATLTVTDNASPTTQTVTLNGTGIAPLASLNPSTTLSFGNQLVTITSAQQIVTLTNSGTDVLKLATVAINPASTNASDFAIVSGAGTTCTAGATIGFTAPSNTCTVALTFTPAAAGLRGPATLNFTDNSGEVTGSVQSITLSGTGQAPSAALRYVPVTPCRLVDTRTTPDGQFAGPSITGGTSRNFTISQNTTCNIPSTAAAYSLNVAVIPSGSLGYLTLWPAGQTQPVVATVSSIDGRVRSNAAIVPAGTGGAISVFASNTTDMVMDINGYFTTAPAALQFYPVTPCRVVDTRNPNGSFGGPSITGNTSRTFPLPTGACNLPGTAQAYSLNLAVVPQGPLGFITAWPTGQT
ncbi:MAG: choice-of-anchor D domain-containing protein, partial [Candidatus Acidiferrales bacterium]